MDGEPTASDSPEVPRQWRRSSVASWVYLAAVIVLAARLGWHVARSDVGGDILIDQWIKSPVRLLRSGRHAALVEQAAEQARFMVSEIQRIPESQTQPEIATGAAWVLDRPTLAFRWRVGVNQSEALRVREAFEDLCAHECLTQAARAVELAPDNPEVWQTRALLLFHVFQARADSGMLRLRCADCVAMLDECARHDPENALYDYLAALAEWSNAGSYNRPAVGWELAIRDTGGFARGEERLAAGLKKPRLMFGGNPGSAALAFLERTSLSAMERVAAAERFLAPYQIYAFNDNLAPWQYARQAAYCRDGRIVEAVATARQTLRIAEQIPAGDHLAHRGLTRQALRSSSLGDLWTLARDAPGSVTEDERTAISQEIFSGKPRIPAWQHATDEWFVTSHARNRVLDSPAGLTAIFLQPLAEVPLAIGLMLYLLLRCFRPAADEICTPGISAHLSCWAVGLAVSFVVLGLCPAGIVPDAMQFRLLRGVSLAAGIVLLSGLLWGLNSWSRVGIRQLLAAAVTLSLPWLLLMHSSRVPWRVSSAIHHPRILAIVGALIVAMILSWLVREDLAFLRRRDFSPRKKAWLIAVLATGAMLIVPWFPYIAELPERKFPIRVPVPSCFRLWSVTDSQVELSVFGVSTLPFGDGRFPEPVPWARALLEWHSYWGLLVASAIALCLIAGWTLVLQWRRSIETWRQMLRSSKLRQMRCVLSAVASSLLAIGAAALLAYAATIPSAIDEVQQRYELRRSRLIDPAAAWNKLIAEFEDRG